MRRPGTKNGEETTMRRFVGGAVVGLSLMAGCGPDNGLTMGRVEGKVTYRGEPIEDGQILFVPDDAKGTSGVPALAKIESDGTFRLSTQDPGDGAIVGHHRVGIRGIEASDTGTAAPVPASGKEIFAARAKATRARRLRPANGKAETVTINSIVYKLTTPAKIANPNESGISLEVARGSNRFAIDIQEDGSVKVN
jgi:hypothetical protein